ncbi:MAG: chromosomal replication initiator protein DnaA [Deltaproteobacteria bacterium]
MGQRTDARGLRTDANRLWGDACSLIAGELPQKDFETWILELTPAEFSDDLLTLEAPFGLFRDRVRKAFLPAIERAVSTAAERRCRVAVVVGSFGGTRISRGERPRPAGERPRQRTEATRHRKTFDNFIVGTSNRLGFNAAKQVADAKASAANPLFIYGGVGLGKTHLLLAISHALRGRGRRVLYYQGEDFTRKMVDALRLERMDAFRREFRLADALLIDDVQFLAGKVRTQQELYHAFNLIHAAGKPIVLAADRGPRDLEKLEKGLASRFQGGLLADLGPLDSELRLKLLKAKAEEVGLVLPSGVAEKLSPRLRGSVRDIEGLVARLAAAVTHQSAELNDRVIETLVAPYVGHSGPVGIDSVIDTVAWAHGITRQELLSRDRTRRVAWPRHVAAYLCRKLTSSSLPEIGEALGGRNHTSILRAVRSVAERAATDAACQSRLEELERILRGGEAPGLEAGGYPRG